MPNINITVAAKIATNMSPGVPIVCGNNDYTLTFTFDQEWAADAIKTARFVFIMDGQVRYKEVAFSGNNVTAPVLSNITAVYVGVYAGDLRTTTPARILCDRSILCGTAMEHEEPGPDVYNQILAACNEIAGNAAAIASAGYGSALQTVAADTEEELEASLLAAAESMANHTTKQVKAMLSFLEFSTYSAVEIYKHSGGNQLIVTIRSPRNNGTTLQKVYTSANGWKPVEWYNPPMSEGVEYRTIDRWGGVPVYRKRIVLEHTEDVGSDGLSLGFESIVHNLAFEKIVEVNAFAHCADGEIVPFQFENITDREFRIDTSQGVWKTPTYEINIAFTKPQ